MDSDTEDSDSWQEVFDLLYARIGNSVVQFLQGAGLGVNDRNKYGKTMLSCAADNVNERMELVKHLVKIGADVNVTNSDGSIPLHMAAKHGDKKMVQFFLSLGVNVDSRDNEDNTPLHYLAQETDVSIYTREKHQELVHFLLDSNANLNAVNKEGRTPLILAAQNSRKDLVELFIRLGASVDCCDKSGWTVLHHSSLKGWSGIVRLLVEGDFNIDLNARTSAGVTSLYYAATFSHFGVAEYLFESGADVHTCLMDARNHTALHMACWKGALDEVKCYVKMGSHLNAKNSTGATPLLMAVRKSHLKIVEYLIDSGADANCYGRFDNTPLHNACNYGTLDIVKALIKKGSNINSQNCSGDTPLHQAVDLIDLGIAKYLLDAGADFNIQNIYGKSAFDRILDDHPIRLEGIALFLEKGAYFQYKVDIVKLFIGGVLKDWKLCTQAIINKFNNADLLKIYKMPVIAKRLPSIEKLKIVSDTNAAQAIEQSVRNAIQSIGYCNFVFEVPPLTLSILSVKALVKYYN